jgi:hypothetical protein
LILPYHDVAISAQTEQARVIFEENSGLADAHDGYDRPDHRGVALIRTELAPGGERRAGVTKGRGS